MGKWYQALAGAMGLITAAAHAQVPQDLLDTAPPPAPTAPTEAANDELFVDGLIAGYQAQLGVPGYSVAMVRAGEISFAKGYGIANTSDGMAVSPDASRFYIGSISKTFIWTAIMVLVDRGELDLDTDVNEYLKSYKVPAGPEPLTVNDLMAHRPGLEDTIAVFLPKNSQLPLAEAMAATEPKQVFGRGEKTAYSNWASNLAALVIEDVTGRQYNEFVLNEILRPIGMTKTSINNRDVPQNRAPIARSYIMGGFGPIEAGQLDQGAFAPLGGMASTAEDMARWMLFHLGRGELNGVRLMSEETYALMRSRAFSDQPAEGPAMAHGFMDVPYRSTVLFGHGGSINDFLSNMMIAPELGIGIYISQNSAVSNAPLSNIPNLLVDRELKARDAMETPRRSVADPVAAAQEAAGVYQLNRRAFTRVDRFFGSQFMLELRAFPETPALLAPGATAAPFLPIAPDVWENRRGDRFTFLRNDAGEIVRVIDPSGSATWERVKPLETGAVVNVAGAATLAFAVTTWLGLWRRFGRGSTNTTGLGRALSLLTLASTGVLGYAALQATQVAPPFPSFAAIMTEYPPQALVTLMSMATLVTITGVVMVLTLIPALFGSGWSIFRKGHHLFYVASFGTLAYLLWKWGLAFGTTVAG